MILLIDFCGICFVCRPYIDHLLLAICLGKALSLNVSSWICRQLLQECLTSKVVLPLSLLLPCWCLARWRIPLPVARICLGEVLPSNARSSPVAGCAGCRLSSCLSSTCWSRWVAFLSVVVLFGGHYPLLLSACRGDLFGWGFIPDLLCWLRPAVRPLVTSAYCAGLDVLPLCEQ
jgi:hypothetical protein